MSNKLKQYTAYVTVNIEAEDDAEAYKIYCAGDWDIDGHTLMRWTDDGIEVEVDESNLEEA